MTDSNSVQLPKTADNYLDDYHSKLKELQRLGTVLSPDPAPVKVSKDLASSERIQKNFSLLKYEFQDTLTKLEKRFLVQLDGLHELKEEIENTKQELERVHHIKATADNISMMLQKAKQKVLDLDNECIQKIESVKQKINEQRTLLEAEKQHEYEKIKDKQLACDQEINEKWDSFHSESEAYKSQILQETESEKRRIVEGYENLIKELKEKETSIHQSYTQIKQRYEFSKAKYDQINHELKIKDRQVYETEKVQQLQVELKEDIQSISLEKKKAELEKEYKDLKDQFLSEQREDAIKNETALKEKIDLLDTQYQTKLEEIEKRYQKESDAKIEQLKLTFSTELKKQFEDEKQLLEIEHEKLYAQLKSESDHLEKENKLLVEENRLLKEELENVPNLLMESVQKVESDLFEQHLDQSKKMVEGTKIKYEKELEDKGKTISALEYDLDKKSSEISYLAQKLKRVESHLEYLMNHDGNMALEQPIMVSDAKPRIVRSIRSK